MSRDTMVYYRSFRESLRELPPDLYKVVSETIFDYAFEGIAPGADSNAVAKALFIAIKPVIDNAHNRYDACVENGRKGGAPRGSRNNPSGKAGEPNQRPNQRPNQEPNLYKDKDKDVDKDIDSKGDCKGEDAIPESNGASVSTNAGGSAPAPHKYSESFLKFQQWITDNAPRVAKMKEPMTEEQSQKLKDKYPTEQICEVLQAMHNYEPLIRRNRSAYLTASNWLRRHDQTTTQTNHETKRIYKDL